MFLQFQAKLTSSGHLGMSDVMMQILSDEIAS
jgi:hypothetical protein